MNAINQDRTGNTFMRRYVRTLLVLVVIVALAGLVIRYAEAVRWDRAVSCSRMLHKYADSTLVPLTDDASWKIGACLLYFEQTMNGENQ